ncbi:FAD-dependent monooxygenase [Paraferrimonas haliotis]|uniref:FAD-dependent 2-octaprenylphenol hydroxylase n=1 Tax=Paraferrimonas haliotis TaxID=2013866 RepID=A0AA37TX24_9GAMM|nr:FAD-dependent monooxygenase [Paraferrimonas haliotis]GLS83036.1 FAD-dependent 2-octaprenylphenol hydroxylase [Paraferrimonas haliotis]
MATQATSITPPIQVDIAVVGAGMVGLASALGFAQQGLSVAIVAPEESLQLSDDYQLRVSAINYASQRLLTRLGAWHHIPRKAPYQSMEVWDKDGIGRIHLDGQRLGHSDIGHIIENQAVQIGLEQALSGYPNVVRVSDKIASLSVADDAAWLATESQQMVSAKLIVGADGAHSKVRSLANIGIKFQDYGHYGLVATVHTERPHLGVARQVFLKDGPLAFLPLGNPHLSSIVWSTSPDNVKQLSECSPEQFDRQITAAFDSTLGLCNVQSARPYFPLTMRLANDFVKERIVLMGDAAHTIHPLAGQGVNLGLLDCAVLLEKVDQWQQKEADYGRRSYLVEYQRWRNSEAIEMIATMEAFKRLYAGNHPLKQGLRDLGMNLVNKAAPVKDRLVAKAMGLGRNLPRWCQ